MRPDLGGVGRMLLTIGLSIALLGLVLMLIKQIPFLGRLPGDIRIEGKRFSCFLPIATSLLISLLLTIVVNVLLHLLRR